MTFPTYSGRLELHSSGLLYVCRQADLPLVCLGHIENVLTSVALHRSDEKDYRILQDVWRAEQHRRARSMATGGR